MSKAKAKKICIVVTSLGKGGAERSSALLSVLLFDIGYEVHIVSVLDKVDYPYKGKLLNLGKLKSQDDSTLGRLKRLKVLKNYLKRHDFDYIIDNRSRKGFIKEYIISRWLYDPKKTIYSVHSYKTDIYVNSKRILGNILYDSAYKIVTVSVAISKRLKDYYGYKNVKVIHNTVAEDIVEEKREKLYIDDYILFYGRLDDDVKNITLLLNAYSKSKLPRANKKLIILGDGKDRAILKKKVINLKIEPYVEFLDFQQHPFDIVSAAYFTILTSRYEGFPMVLVESLSLGTPVVSVNCKSGPDEIIINEYNGLLVENHNIDALVSAMNRMLDDKNLYLQCKSNAKLSVEKFSKNQIVKQWQTILK